MEDNPYCGPNSEELSTPAPARQGPLAIALKVLAVLGILGVLILFLLPNVRTARPAARRNVCVNHLRQIAIALHTYASTYGEFPPAYTVDADGKPLHSWRTLLLPYLEQRPLYESIDLTKPWDDPVNEKARQTVVSEFKCPSATGAETSTTYLAVVTDDSCIRPGQSCRLEDVTDGPDKTLLVIDIDSARAVHWMSPENADEQVILDIGPGSDLQHPGGVEAVFADASVHFLADDLPAAQRRALISAAGNDNDELTDLD